MEWDKRHGEVEKYDKSCKKHQGSYDPETGGQIKDGKPNRWPPKFSTPVMQPYDGPQYLPSYQPGVPMNPNVRNTVIIGGAAIIIIEAIETYWPAVLAL